MARRGSGPWGDVTCLETVAGGARITGIGRIERFARIAGIVEIGFRHVVVGHRTDRTLAGRRSPWPFVYASTVPETPFPTPTQRVVDAAMRKGVTLEVRIFAESTHTAEEAAAAVGAELGQIVKSLVFVAPTKDATLEPILCLVSGPNRVDLARLAAVTGEPDVRRATAVEAKELTGYTIGGIPPIGHPRAVRVIMDPDLGRFQVVWAAAGTPTAVFPVPPATLRMLSNAVVAPICEERRQADVLAEGSGLPGGRLPQPNAGA
jgi:prolyl-tRNA editing enzyme YbaK/EbsC (Cys-tRNA(Pro) deacylase)